MSRAAVVCAACATFAVLLTAGATADAAYRSGPPPGHTGGFGEPDCSACHFDAVRDDARGRLSLDAPTRYQGGARYTLTVALRHPELRAAGFQLSARFAEGADAGRQAGVLEPAGPDVRAQVGADGVIYLSHSEAGVTPDSTPANGADGVRRWSVDWVAPLETSVVVFDLAANAANDDASEFGDRVYRARHSALPAGGAADGGRKGAPWPAP